MSLSIFSSQIFEGFRNIVPKFLERFSKNLKSNYFWDHQNWKRPRTLDAYRMRFALQPCPAGLTQFIRPASRAEPGGQSHRMEGAEPSKLSVQEALGSKPSSKQGGCGSGERAVRLHLGAPPASNKRDHG